MLVCVDKILTIIANSPTIGLNFPMDIIVNETADNSIIVANSHNYQVISFYDNGLSINNASLLAQNWDGGFLNMPVSVSIDPNERSNLYVSDLNNNCIIKIFSMQVISPVLQIVAG
jgi:hypothetical protein